MVNPVLVFSVGMTVHLTATTAVSTVMTAQAMPFGVCVTMRATSQWEQPLMCTVSV